MLSSPFISSLVPITGVEELSFYLNFKVKLHSPLIIAFFSYPNFFSEHVSHYYFITSLYAYPFTKYYSNERFFLDKVLTVYTNFLMCARALWQLKHSFLAIQNDTRE